MPLAAFSSFKSLSFSPPLTNHYSLPLSLAYLLAGDAGPSISLAVLLPLKRRQFRRTILSCLVFLNKNSMAILLQLSSEAQLFGSSKKQAAREKKNWGVSGSPLLRFRYMVVAATWLLSTLQSGMAAQNITALLENDPDYSVLNDLLTKTGVANEINKRNSITLLAVDNAALAPVAAQLGNTLTLSQVADILRYHVLLDYFNPTKLSQLSNGTTVAPTLYQSTGRAAGQLGFVNITDVSGGNVDVGLPIKGAGFNATILKPVADIPYNLSVLQLSNAVIPAGLLAAAPVPTPAQTPVPTPAPSPISSPSPLLAPQESPSPSTESPVPAAPKPSYALPVVSASAHVILLSAIPLICSLL